MSIRDMQIQAIMGESGGMRRGQSAILDHAYFIPPKTKQPRAFAAPVSIL